jgi:hypothetical protein
MILTASEILGAFQLGLISHAETREALGFSNTSAETEATGE